MKKILLLSIFLLNLLTLVSNIDMGNQMLAQNMGSEVTVYPCKTFNPTTGNDDWHFSTSPCNNELPGVCVTACRYCKNSMPCDNYSWHSCPGKYNAEHSGNDNYPSYPTYPPATGGGGGGGTSSGGGTGTSPGTNNESSQYGSYHVPSADEKCLSYKEGKELLPSSYPPQDCSMNCFTTSMEYCCNFYKGSLDDKSLDVRAGFEEEYLLKYGHVVCSEGVEIENQCEFLKLCGFDVQNVSISLPNAVDNIQNAILNNHPVMVTIGYHEDVVIGYHTSTGLFEVIDPGHGNIHTIEPSQIRDAYIINGYPSVKK